MAKKNKIGRFFIKYAAKDNDSPAPINENYYTDEDISSGEKPIFKEGIRFQGEATSGIVNSMLRQVSMIAYGVAQLMANNVDKKATITTANDVSISAPNDVTTLLKNEEVFAYIEHSIKILSVDVANARIAANTSSGVATAVGNSDKLITGKSITDAIKNDVITETEGFLLDARQGKILNDRITTVNTDLTNKINTDITAAKKAVSQNVRVKYLNNVTATVAKDADDTEAAPFLYIWKGSLSAYNTFADNNSALISQVLAIIE